MRCGRPGEEREGVGVHSRQARSPEPVHVPIVFSRRQRPVDRGNEGPAAGSPGGACAFLAIGRRGRDVSGENMPLLHKAPGYSR